MFFRRSKHDEKNSISDEEIDPLDPGQAVYEAFPSSAVVENTITNTTAIKTIKEASLSPAEIEENKKNAALNKYESKVAVWREAYAADKKKRFEEDTTMTGSGDIEQGA